MVEAKLQKTGVAKHFVRSYEPAAMNDNGSLCSIKVEGFGGSFLTTICRSWLDQGAADNSWRPPPQTVLTAIQPPT